MFLPDFKTVVALVVAVVGGKEEVGVARQLPLVSRRVSTMASAPVSSTASSDCRSACLVAAPSIFVDLEVGPFVGQQGLGAATQHRLVADNRPRSKEPPVRGAFTPG
jgi:hypothetical protein